MKQQNIYHVNGEWGSMKVAAKNEEKAMKKADKVKLIYTIEADLLTKDEAKALEAEIAKISLNCFLESIEQRCCIIEDKTFNKVEKKIEKALKKALSKARKNLEIIGEDSSLYK